MNSWPKQEMLIPPSTTLSPIQGRQFVVAVGLAHKQCSDLKLGECGPPLVLLGPFSWTTSIPVASRSGMREINVCATTEEGTLSTLSERQTTYDRLLAVDSTHCDCRLHK